MAHYKVTIRVEVDRVIEADSVEEAFEKVDIEDMRYEIKQYSLDEEYIVKEI